jgi:vesicle-associated membrane protein 7
LRAASASMSGGILYGLVTRPAITRVLLKKIPPVDGKLSYLYEPDYVFHYVVHDGLTCLCMCGKEFSRMTAFRFLAALESEFLALFGGRWTSATAYQLNNDFKSTLDRLMREYSSQKDAIITKINSQLGDIKETMTKNIDLVLSRGEKIELLVDKSQQMEEHAFKFQKRAKTLRRTMCWQNAKWWVFIVIVLLVSADGAENTHACTRLAGARLHHTRMLEMRPQEAQC